MATRLIAGVLREVWRADAPLDGGASEVIPTGIKCSTSLLSCLQPLVVLDQVLNAPSITGALSVVNRRLVVTLTNAAIPGNSAMWTLDVTLNHSIQQARGAPPAPVLVVGGAPQASGDLEDQLIERAKALTGINQPQATFDDYELCTTGPLGGPMPLGFQDLFLGLLEPVVYATLDQTALLASSTDTPAHFCEVTPCGTGAWKTTSVRTTPWYAGFKARMETGVDVAGRIGLSIQDDTEINNIEVGALGRGSIVNFSVTIGDPTAPEAVIDSGVPLDNNVHVFEVWRRTGNIFFAIDGVVVGNCAVPTGWSGVSTVSVPYANNGGVAAERAGTFFWYLLLAESE